MKTALRHTLYALCLLALANCKTRSESSLFAPRAQGPMNDGDRQELFQEAEFETDLNSGKSTLVEGRCGEQVIPEFFNMNTYNGSVRGNKAVYIRVIKNPALNNLIPCNVGEWRNGDIVEDMEVFVAQSTKKAKTTQEAKHICKNDFPSKFMGTSEDLALAPGVDGAWHYTYNLAFSTTLAVLTKFNILPASVIPNDPLILAWADNWGERDELYYSANGEGVVPLADLTKHKKFQNPAYRPVLERIMTEGLSPFCKTPTYPLAP